MLSRSGTIWLRCPSPTHCVLGSFATCLRGDANACCWRVFLSLLLESPSKRHFIDCILYEEWVTMPIGEKYLIFFIGDASFFHEMSIPPVWIYKSIKTVRLHNRNWHTSVFHTVIDQFMKEQETFWGQRPSVFPRLVQQTFQVHIMPFVHAPFISFPGVQRTF